MNQNLKVALAQISPVWLNKKKTTEKIISYIEEAGKQDCELVVFGEGLLPGYPSQMELSLIQNFIKKYKRTIFLTQ